MLKYTLIRDRDGNGTLTVFPPVAVDASPVILRDDHPHFAKVVHQVADRESTFEDVERAADLSLAVGEQFLQVTERVAVANGRVFFDGDPVDSTITKQIVRALDAGANDWMPLVRFMENIAANPVEHSREQLYDWLRAGDFAITESGDIVGYKGVESDGNGGYQSTYGGVGSGAIVNGRRVEGKVPNAVGDTITMPRADVVHDPSASCSRGLHVGTYDYAKRYANGALLKVHVNPRDVVSVPTGEGEKVRVCRYVVEDIIDAPETRWLATNDEAHAEFELEDPDETCECCGEPLEDGSCLNADVCETCD